MNTASPIDLYNTMRAEVPRAKIAFLVSRENPDLSPEAINARIDALLQWLAAIPLAKAQNKGLQMIESIDIVWHAFILHTKEYAEFCGKFFGRFVHHLPPSEFDSDRTEDASYTLSTIRGLFGDATHPELEALATGLVKCCGKHD